MIVENIKPKGTLTLVLTDIYGNVREQREENLVVNAGLAFITSRLIDASSTVMSHIAVGTGVTAAAVGNTTLVTESARVALTTATRVTTTATNDSVQYVATFGAGVATAALTEAGIFNAASAGTMLSRVTFSVINKGANDTLTITWKVTFA